MDIGEQIHAPYGFEGLVAGIVYHFMISDGSRNRVVLVTFGAPSTPTAEQSTPPNPRKPASTLAYLQRHRFEEALQSGLVRPCSTQRELPHWFGEMTVADLLHHDQLDHQRRIPHSQRIDTMLGHLWPALAKLLDILKSDNPNAMLSGMARACRPIQHEVRFRTAFFTYVAFGRERLALHYPIQNIGKWDRGSRTTKYGRPSVLGQWHGHSSCVQAVQDKCTEGYRNYAIPGRSMRTIYEETMRRDFGCISATDSNQRKSFIHPDGEPFPTYGQFAYRVRQTFDLETRQLLKFGSARVRSKLAPSQGKFTDAIGNAMEALQEDGYFLEEVAVGYLEGSHLPKVCVVRIVCVATGMIVGIGFALRGENAEAYRMAKFCMAVDKVWYCSLFGITITEDEWPSIGLPMHEVTDRGPGATGGADASDGAYRPIIKELVGSYSGQSKASVETRHPKSEKLEGAPHIKLTRKTIVELVRREIWRAIESNTATNVESRLGPEAIAAGTLSSPIGLWNHLSKRGRSFAYRTTREQAIRRHLCKVDLTVRDGAIFFMDFRYWSKELRNSGLLKLNVTSIQGYMLPMCVRHIFLDTPLGILTVDATFGIRTNGEERFLSVAELEQLAQLRSKERAAFRIHRHAAKAEVAERFEAETGTPYNQSDLRLGRARRGNAASLDEARQIMPILRANGGRR